MQHLVLRLEEAIAMSEVYEVTLTVLVEDMKEIEEIDKLGFQPEVIDIKEV